MKEEKSELKDISDSQKMCRFCTHPVKCESKCMYEEELEAIQKLTPEVDIISIKDTVVCKECSDSSSTHNFPKNCLEVDSSVMEGRKETSLSDLFIKTDKLDEKFDFNKMEISIKTECVDIKSEDDMSEVLPQSCNEGLYERSDCKDAEEDGYKYNTYVYETKYNTLPHNDAYRNDITQHELEHKVEMYECNDCNYKTKYRSYLKQHQLKHKDPSQVQLYRCNDCDFKTKYRRHIRSHQLKHKDPSEIQMYKCNDCNFESRYKKNIQQHQIKHKDSSQVQMYKCNNCGYKAKHMKNIKRHQLKHKDSSQVEMYKCNDCNYKTKYKCNIKKHQVKHEDRAQAQMYKCNVCDHETKYKGNIKKHHLKHKDPLQV